MEGLQALVASRLRRRQRSIVLTSAELGAELGARATLVQFSSAFCSPCRATRTLLRDVTARIDDVAYVDVDAESHLGLVRRLGIIKTPTVVILDRTGAVVRQASGVPSRHQINAVLAGM